MPPAASDGWLSKLAIYKDARMYKILFIGVIQGFPWLLIGSMLSLWLKSEGLSRSGIGFFGIIFTVYAFNALWAPLVDGLNIPLLWRLGQRRSWIILMQVCIIALTLLVATRNPGEELLTISALIFLIALCSATQDVAVDALRIELIGHEEPEKIGGGSAMATSGWWIGYGGIGAIALVLAEKLQQHGVEKYWQYTYSMMIFVPILCVVLLLFIIRERPRAGGNAVLISAPTTGRFNSMAMIWVEPVMNFVRSYGLRIGVSILALVFLFKIGEAFLGRMSIIFYEEVGFKKSDIALYSKGFGTLALCVFAVIGSVINARYGLLRGLLIGGIAMAATNLLFAVLFIYPEKWLFATAVVTDQFTTAMSTVALVAFLSQLCDRAYAATQYAALASLGNLSRTTLAAGSGVLIDGLGGNWSVFFVITTLMVLPSLMLLLYVSKELKEVLEGRSTKVI